MQERKIDLYKILEKDEELFQDVIDGRISYTLAKSFIYGWMKEACTQAIELAAENARMKSIIKYTLPDGENSYDIIDKNSILDTIKQIE